MSFAVVVAVLLCASLVYSAVWTFGADDTAYIYRLGKLIEKKVDGGIFFVRPFTDKVYILPPKILSEFSFSNLVLKGGHKASGKVTVEWVVRDFETLVEKSSSVKASSASNMISKNEKSFLSIKRPVESLIEALLNKNLIEFAKSDWTAERGKTEAQIVDYINQASPIGGVSVENISTSLSIY